MKLAAFLQFWRRLSVYFFVTSKSERWYSRSPMPPRKAVALLAFAFLGMLLFTKTRFREAIELSVTQRIDFPVRRQLGDVPSLDHRLKIFSLDHQTLTELQTENVSADDWLNLLLAVMERRPAMILIDKDFGLPIAKDAQVRREFRNALRSGVPIVGSLFFSDAPVPAREPLPLERSDFDISKLLKDPIAPNWMVSTEGVPYGPHESVASAFSYLGYTRSFSGPFVYPFVDKTGGHVVPHWSLYAGAPLKIEKGKLFTSVGEVPLDSHGRILPDLASPAFYARQILSLVGTFQKAREGAPLDRIKPNDVVAILTRLTPDTPDASESHVLISLLNSVLTGRWLKSVSGEPIMVFLACLAGTLVSFLLEPLACAAFVAMGIIALAALGLILFLNGLILPWLTLCLSFIFAAGLVAAEKFAARARMRSAIRASLGGSVDPQRLERLLNNFRRLRLDPASQVLSIVVIEIVGFSESAERRPPHEVFASRSEIRQAITEIVMRYGGLINQSHDDSIVCLFGYGFGVFSEMDSHASLAMVCAMELQRETLKRNLIAGGQNRPLYPLRVGIHTAEVYVGDRGRRSTIDIAIIGGALKHARELAGACENFMVSCGFGTQVALSHSMLKIPLERKLLKAPNGSDMIEVFEFNPFHENPSLLEEANQAHRNFLGVERLEPRWPVPLGQIRVLFERGKGDLYNFSPNGLAVTWDEFYGRGTVFNLTFESPGGKLEKLFEESGLTRFPVEIRWGRPHEGRFLHGLLLKNMSPREKELMVACLRTYLEKNSMPVSFATAFKKSA